MASPSLSFTTSGNLGAMPTIPIGSQPPTLTPQHQAILQALAQHAAANSSNTQAPASQPVSPTLPQPRYQVVKHPAAPARLPFAIKDNHTGGYVTGGSPLFPRVFATAAEAKAAIPAPAVSAVNVTPSARAAYTTEAARPTSTAKERFQVKANPDAPARYAHSIWDNQTGDWSRDRFGFAKVYGTPAEAQADMPVEGEPAIDYDLSPNNSSLGQLASGRYQKLSTAHKANTASLPKPAHGTHQARPGTSGQTPGDDDKPVTIYQIYEAAKAAGDPHPAVTAAQWAQESGFGKHPSGRFNYFNVKGKGTTVPTTEYVNGHHVHTKASFRNYNSLQQSIADHTRLLGTKHYAGYGKAKTDQQAVAALTHAGYATDPNYAGKLLSIIKKYFPSQLNKPPKVPKSAHKQEITEPPPNIRPNPWPRR